MDKENNEKNKKLIDTDYIDEGLPTEKKPFPAVLWGIIVIIMIFVALEVSSDISYQKAKKALINSGLGSVEDKIFETETSNDTSKSTIVGDSNVNLVRQKLQIEELQKQYKDLRTDLDHLKTQDRLAKIIVTFSEITSKIDLGKNYNPDLQKLEALASSDISLTNKIEKLKNILKKEPKSAKTISLEFNKAIPEIITAKHNDAAPINFIGKIKKALSKLITIRRVDGIVGSKDQNVDYIIVTTSKLIEEEKYGEALDLLDSLGNNYQSVLVKINFDLQNADDLQKINQQIFSYLKELANV